MPRAKNNADSRNNNMMVLQYLTSEEVLQQLSNLEPHNTDDESPVLQNLVDKVIGYRPSLEQKSSNRTEIIDHVINHAIQLLSKEQEQGHDSYLALFRELQSKRQVYMSQGTASHWQKQTLITMLGLNSNGPSISDLMAGHALPMVIHSRGPTQMTRYQWMSEHKHKEHVLVKESTGYYVVPPDKSVFFLSPASGEGLPEIELVVICNIAMDAPISGALYQWLFDIAETACSERRDTRPKHPGKMVQVGLNGGPRHARVLGWAKSYTKVLSQDNRQQHDTDIVGATGIVWSLIKSAAPREIMEHVEQCLQNEGMPDMATRDVAEGIFQAKALQSKADGNDYKLSTARRSPPEA
ncbi:uncharacterized protein C8Q71DRAFT_893685 [Rhodofomes roseus]|uniref:Uncharacterized protein n=1 Tax=Rhodofomes roseus TaxID=34475 RepID=A0ABQ8JX85_9APHY|nr:uncharacterized protein C8Q71DRAFT_893685 [Rhodofomes roseus]KAH9828646.1 hypothetical protein C8Q71DRAFT_893685 [Rhodofomes roseus]